MMMMINDGYFINPSQESDLAVSSSKSLHGTTAMESPMAGAQCKSFAADV